MGSSKKSSLPADGLDETLQMRVERLREQARAFQREMGVCRFGRTRKQLDDLRVRQAKRRRVRRP